jgi:nitrogen regulatory protein PII
MMRLVRTGADHGTIAQTVEIGKIRDGKIFIYKLEQVVRIRTGETGSNAL